MQCVRTAQAKFEFLDSLEFQRAAKESGWRWLFKDVLLLARVTIASVMLCLVDGPAGPTRAGPGPRVGHRSIPPAPKYLMDLIIFQGSRPPMHCYNAAFRWQCPPTHLLRHNFICKISLSRV